MEKTVNKKRLIYLDILNIIAILCVIAMHCNGVVHSYSTQRWWRTSLIVECVAYFAVPLFLMISGANLFAYRKKYDTKTFFKKRFCKVLIPFIFWAFVMFIWKNYIEEISLANMNFLDLISAFFQSKEEYTYYFLFLILGIYLTLPILSNLADDKYRKSLWYAVAVYFLFNAILPNILGTVGVYYNTDLGIAITGYMMYVILGYLLSTGEVDKKYRIIIYVSAIVAVLYRYFMTLIFSNQIGKIDNRTWGYTQFHVYILTSAIFLFVKNLRLDDKINSEKIKNIISKISSCSFGIYLIHLIVRFYICKVFNINILSWEWRALGFILVYIVSLGIVYLLKKIPIVRKIVP